MKLKQLFPILFCGLILFALSACGSNEPPIDVEETIAAAIVATQEAADSAAQTVVTATPTDEPAVAEDPTETPEPTFTPIPTNTSEPTLVPTETLEPTPAGPLIISELDDNRILYEFIDDAFSIASTNDWSTLPIDPTLFENAAFTEIASQNEELSELYTSELFRDLVAAGIRFYAVNNRNSAESATPATINVMRQPQTGNMATDQYADFLAAQLAELVTFAEDTDIARSETSLGDDPAVKLIYTSQFINPLGETLSLHTTQYIIVKNGASYIVSITIPTEMVDALLADAEAIAESVIIK